MNGDEEPFSPAPQREERPQPPEPQPLKKDDHSPVERR